MAGRKQSRTKIEQLSYRPSIPYRLDLEIFSISDLRRRVRKEKLHATYQYTFHELVCVTSGKCTQLVDGKPIHCEPGSLLVLRPGQTHNFGPEENWHGWLILFRPEFLLPTSVADPDLKLMVGLEKLPERLSLSDDELRSITAVITQMREDTGINAQPKDLHALLRYQLYTLLLRLTIVQDRQELQSSANSRLLQRFKKFQQLVEKNFARWRQVADYAKQLGCSEKSLTRAAMETIGINAKALIASRINLEAKRLLSHTDLSVALISESLRFVESTNFIKFFKRETGCTPIEFRRQHDAINTADQS